MKKVLFVIVLFCTAIISAQNVKVVYELTTRFNEENFKMLPKETRDELIKTLSTPDFYDLVFQNGISLYKKQKKSKDEKESFDELKSNSNNGYEIQVIHTDDINSGAYQNFKTNEYLELKAILNKPFFIKDKIASLDWKLTNEEEKIGNFDCKKATATYDHKNIIAWYTDELPIPVGPSIYNGLPGLIIKLEVDKQTYKAISIENITDKITIEKPTSEDKGISRDKFSEIEREKIEALSM